MVVMISILVTLDNDVDTSCWTWTLLRLAIGYSIDIAIENGKMEKRTASTKENEEEGQLKMTTAP